MFSAMISFLSGLSVRNDLFASDHPGHKLCSPYKKYKILVREQMYRRSGCLPDTGENNSDSCCDRDHIAPFMELQRQVVIELERMERMPD